jgi:threonine dehydrogenase-like Zn-dependent dehydrogenase
LILRAAVFNGEWAPRKNVKLTEEELETKKIRNGSHVWRNTTIKLEELDIGQIDPYQLLVRVKACGICGSDVHMYEKDDEGYMLYPYMCRLPVVAGHEFSGTVEKVGNKVNDFMVGDLVCLEEMNWCGYCIPCRNGHVNQCKNIEEIGFTLNGAFAEYVKVYAKYCWKINSFQNAYRSEEKIFEAGSLVEPTSVAYNALFINAGGINPGAYVVVYGLGPIVLAATSLAKIAGASNVIAFETKEQRIELAKKMCVDNVFNPIQLENEGIKIHEKILEITEGFGADLQVEAAGAHEKTLPEMEKSLAVSGKIVSVGWPISSVPIHIDKFMRTRSKVYGSLGHSGYGIFQNVVRLMGSGKIDMTKIVTSRFKLDNFLDAMEQAKKRIDGKIIIHE